MDFNLYMSTCSQSQGHAELGSICSEIAMMMPKRWPHVWERTIPFQNKCEQFLEPWANNGIMCATQLCGNVVYWFINKLSVQLCIYCTFKFFWYQWQFRKKCSKKIWQHIHINSWQHSGIQRIHDEHKMQKMYHYDVYLGQHAQGRAMPPSRAWAAWFMCAWALDLIVRPTCLHGGCRVCLSSVPTFGAGAATDHSEWGRGWASMRRVERCCRWRFVHRFCVMSTWCMRVFHMGAFGNTLHTWYGASLCLCCLPLRHQHQSATRSFYKSYHSDSAILVSTDKKSINIPRSATEHSWSFFYLRPSEGPQEIS